MNRVLENEFLSEFAEEGVATITLEMMLYQYCGIGGWIPARADYPDGVLAEIRERTKQHKIWPWSGIDNNCPLMDEIKDNIDSCLSEAVVRDNYIIELLKKYHKWTWLYSLGKAKLDEISNTVYEGSLEQYFHRWRSAYQSFAKKLAVVLAERGVNILELQQRCGISIIDNLNADDLWIDFGTPQLADYYLSRLKSNTTPKKSRQDNIITDRAKKYFARAIKAGYMKETQNGYEWIWGGRFRLIRLAYFLRKIYNWDGCQRTPYKGLEQLFGVFRLDSATSRLLDTKKEQPWRKEIDNLFID